MERDYQILYRESHYHLVIDLGLVDFDMSVPPFCPAAEPLLPTRAELGKQWNDQNPGQPNLVYDQMGRPVPSPGHVRNTKKVNFVEINSSF